ncbi:MAG: thioredoxin family protein [Planctomycetota bacterium]
MVATPSTMQPLGSAAPDFALPEPATGQTVSRSDFAGKPLLVMFLCNHCPFVHHVAPALAQLSIDYKDKLGIVGVQSNDVEAYPDDAPDKMPAEARNRGYAFPYLFDADQSVAKAYTAACTPDFFLYDADHKLAYRGQIDDTRPFRVKSGVYDARDGAAHGRDLRAAIDVVLQGQTPGADQKPSIGCNIKWKPGGAPAYFTA